MQKKKFKSWILTGLLAFVLLVGATFGLAGCDNNANINGNAGEPESFSCSNKTFVYDGWESNVELSEAESLEISGLALGSYGSGQFVFDADGTFVTTGLESNWSGTWEIVDQTVVLTKADESQEVLTIVGTRFYLVQQVSETMELHIFYKLA